MERPTTSTRDGDELRARIERLCGRAVTDLRTPSGTGMSSETVLFDTADGGSYVARLAPDPSAVPVFPVYDLPGQVRTMRLVAERTAVPVPDVVWHDDDAIVMRRVDGVVPPDIMPYTFGMNWLYDATPDERARLQESSVTVLAHLHAVSPPDFLEIDRPEPTALRRHLAEQRDYLAWVSSDGVRSPLLERGFAWLEDNRPDDEGPPALSWGDARIGNIIYRDFEPVAVLDWEMATVAPREVDLGWFIYLHRFFEDLAGKFGLPGLPDFLRREDVADAYERMTGHTPRDLDFYTTYAAMRHGAIMYRIKRREIHFGEAEMPDDPDDMIIHRDSIERLLDGSYWS